MAQRPFLAGLAALLLAVAAAPAGAGCVVERLAELPVRMAGLRPLVSAKMNGRDATFIADSGGFFSLVSPEAAARFGLRPVAGYFRLSLRGITGEAFVGVTEADSFSIAGARPSPAQFLVVPRESDDEVDGLLGGNLLSVFDTEYDLANGMIRMFRPQGCGGALAYWSPDNWSEVPIEPLGLGSNWIVGHALVNGASLRVLFDTGADGSMLTEEGARKAGITRDGAGVVPAGPFHGVVGRRQMPSWVAPVQSFEIGREKIFGARLRFGGVEVAGIDMLVGADFFLAHRIYVAKSQRKLYFTYNGGPVFGNDRAVGPTTPPPGETPADAAAFARRGEARLSRRDFEGAIADLSRAIDLEPGEALHFYERGLAHWRNKQNALALADLDQALRLKPNDKGARLARGEMRLVGQDQAGAAADFEVAIAVAPTSRFEAAGAYIEASLFAPAVAQMSAWIADRPRGRSNLAEALNARCRARALWNRDLGEALADCDRALRLDRTGEALDSRGLVHLRLGQWDEAIADYTAALKLAPGLPESLYGRGVARLRKGMTAEGQADIRTATATDPELPERAKQYGFAP